MTLVDTGKNARRRGSVLIIVLWVAFGLVSVALYFAHSMTFELRASDNRVAAVEADQAIEGAARYATYLLANLEEPGQLPDVQIYQRQNVPVGEATFWFIGRGDQPGVADDRSFRLVDEASKLNLNAATTAMLETLPRMTPELAAAIIDWRDANSEVTSGGAEEETYARLNPAYRCKNAPFESVEELRLVYGMTLEILYGEDANRNGILDPNENDGDASPPNDNRNGRLDPGLIEYVTVYTREPTTSSDGTQLADVSVPNQLASALQNAGVTLNGPTVGYSNVLDFYVRSGISDEDFEKVRNSLRNPNTEGLVNVNTASEAVLAALFSGVGVDTNLAATLVAQRQTRADATGSIAWIKDVLDADAVSRAGAHLTWRGYQTTVDVAAVGHHGRGYRRAAFVFDASDGTPRIIFRRDLTHLGWALGRDVRQDLLAAGSGTRSTLNPATAY